MMTTSPDGPNTTFDREREESLPDLHTAFYPQKDMRVVQSRLDFELPPYDSLVLPVLYPGKFNNIN